MKCFAMSRKREKALKELLCFFGKRKETCLSIVLSCLSNISPPLFLKYSQKRQNLLQIGSFQTAVLGRGVAVSPIVAFLYGQQWRNLLTIALNDGLVTAHVYVLFSKTHSIRQKKKKKERKTICEKGQKHPKVTFCIHYSGIP